MQAQKEWRKLKPTVELQLKIYESARIYVQSTPDKKFRKDGSTWLHNQCWNDEVVIHKPQNKPGFFTQLGMMGEGNEQLPPALTCNLDK